MFSIPERCDVQVSCFVSFTTTLLLDSQSSGRGAAVEAEGTCSTIHMSQADLTGLAEKLAAPKLLSGLLSQDWAASSELVWLWPNRP